MVLTRHASHICHPHTVLFSTIPDPGQIAIQLHPHVGHSESIGPFPKSVGAHPVRARCVLPAPKPGTRERSRFKIAEESYSTRLKLIMFDPAAMETYCLPSNI